MNLTTYLETLPVTQGARAGERLKLLSWQRRFVREVFGTGVQSAALSVGRGNGKTALVAGIACAAFEGPLMVPRGEVVIVASSFEQARIAFEHVLAFLGPEVRDRARYSLWDSANIARLIDKETGAVVKCVASDPRRAHGLAPVLVLADEPAQWPGPTSEKMLAALKTSLGKVPGSRLVALGTRPADSSHWFERMLTGNAEYAQCHAATMADSPFKRRTWRKANPSLSHLPDLEAVIAKEAKEAKRDPVALASFRALRLNMGVADTVESVLVDADTWSGLERASVTIGPGYVLGVDLGTSNAMSAVAAYDPETHGLDAFACFPEQPSLAERGMSDGVGNAYVRMAEAGELFQAGEKVSDVHELILAAKGRWGVPGAIVCDRWREAELCQVLNAVGFPLTDLVTRGQGFRDGGADVREYVTALLEGRVTPRASLLLRSAMAEARTVSDPAGNRKLAKASQGGRRFRAKDDAVAAAILAVAEGARRGAAPQPARRMRRAIVA